MTHEYDDPIKPEALVEAARLVARRYRLEERELNHIASEIVHERFCTCVAADDHPENAAILAALIDDVTTRARALLDAGEAFDPVDEASLQSFPASDPPAWAGQGKPDDT